MPLQSHLVLFWHTALLSGFLDLKLFSNLLKEAAKNMVEVVTVARRQNIILNMRRKKKKSSSSRSTKLKSFVLTAFHPFYRQNYSFSQAKNCHLWTFYFLVRIIGWVSLKIGGNCNTEFLISRIYISTKMLIWVQCELGTDCIRHFKLHIEFVFYKLILRECQ